MPVGKKILIKPEWETLSESDAAGKIVFNINPGMSFGTGGHHTTQLCIEQLEKYITPETNLLDLGCGSGILSIISLLLGAKCAKAVDIDENSVHIAYENAERNNVDISKYTVLAGDVTNDDKLIEKISDMQYDVIVANIVADVIIALTPTANKLLKDDGVFITSGIISDREQDVKDALSENGFKIIGSFEKADWRAIVCNKI
jgi:ribosomal protein L11 methyltransferase